jgi:hypothetical protein
MQEFNRKKSIESMQQHLKCVYLLDDWNRIGLNTLKL